MNKAINIKERNNPNNNDFIHNFSLSSSSMSAAPLPQNAQNINKEKKSNLPKIKETYIDNKFKQQLDNKSINKNSTIFLSEIDLNELKESKKDIMLLSSKNEESLCLRKIPKITQKDYDIMKNNIINKENLSKLYNSLYSVSYNFRRIGCGESVGSISPLTFLIERHYSLDKDKIKEINNKYNILKNYIYNYRSINPDGNGFYRAIMFRYFEILILNKKIEHLQNIINDIINCFNSKELQSRIIINDLNIKPELTYKILILIVDLLKINKIKEAHEILVKSFCTCKKFDYAIILYFRYILYDYIRKNENKIYLKTFPVKIGNLLPNEFVTKDGKFLFNDFYQNYLLKFFTESEKIIIYLTPFIIGMELNIIFFDENKEILQRFKCEGNSELQVNDIISLVYIRNNYEIIYTQKDYEKNKNIFNIYENNSKSFLINIKK